MENIVFSVIVPVYNVERYLGKCVDSIMTQTYKNFELILIDDGSTDKSAIICDEYQKKYKNVKVIHKKNGGVTSARKEGAKNSIGEYIVCVDADDYIEKKYLENFYKIIVENKVDIICGGLIVECKNKEIEKPAKLGRNFFLKDDIEKKIYPFLIEDKNSKYFTSSLCGKAIRKKLFQNEQAKISDNIKIGEDKICIIGCIFKANSLYITENNLYYYRYNEESATKSKKVYDWDEQLLIRQHLICRLLNSKINFISQINRNTTHGLFNVVLSNFNRKESYFIIANDIKKRIRKDDYFEIFNNTNFKFFSKGNLAKYALKYRLVFLIYLYYKFKNF